ncbi:MAG: lipoyl(octanoyl) transferase LipB [Candidatus Dormiibacterota bacterium]
MLRQPLRAYDIGTLPYREAWALQRALAAAVEAREQPDSLLLLDHPHVFTMGRRGDPANLVWSERRCAERGVEVVWVDRGGDATYHGPGQLVGYGIVDLTRLGSDILRYVHGLETAIVDYLAPFGIAGNASEDGMIGVWARPPAGGVAEKVAAIGVKATRGITTHGFALNLTTDLSIFNEGIVPCGIRGRRATSVAALTGRTVERRDAARAVAPHLARTFDLTLEWGDPAELRHFFEAPELEQQLAELPLARP